MAKAQEVKEFRIEPYQIMSLIRTGAYNIRDSRIYSKLVKAGETIKFTDGTNYVIGIVKSKSLFVVNQIGR